MSSPILSLQPLYIWQNSGEFLNYGQWKLGPIGATGSYCLGSCYTDVTRQELERSASAISLPRTHEPA